MVPPLIQLLVVSYQLVASGQLPVEIQKISRLSVFEN
jgi:hypothetical protein